MSGFVPRILWAGDVKEQQVVVSGYSTDIGLAFSHCTNTAAPDYALLNGAWKALQDEVANYLAIEPGIWVNNARVYELGEGLVGRMQNIGKRIAALGCTAPPDAPANPQGTDNPNPWASALTWVAAGAIAIAGAYGIAQVVTVVREYVPEPKRLPA